ncbi:MAG: hypothetical protein E7346_07045 [Clostridiales bacterium]|nr:hypothetical protein [Clostridiales bacterium]
MRKITVSDITLKAAEQQELSLTFRERLAIAEKLDASGVDYIELPLLSSSKEDKIVYKTIAKSIKNAIVKIPVGVDDNSLNNAYDCVKDADKFCLQVAMPVSTAQMEYFYHLKAPAMLKKIEELVKAAKTLSKSVEFVAYDAFRAEAGFIESCASTAFAAGAESIVVCDDAGEAFPEDYADIVKKIKGVCGAKIIVNPSDALKMSAACAVSAISVGADGVVTSVTGDYLDMAVVADVIRAKKFVLDADCNIDVTNVKYLTSAIGGVTDIVSEQEKDGEHFTLDANASIKDVATAVAQLGYELSDDDVGKVYEELKKLSAKKELIDTKELEAVIASTAMQVPSTYHLVNYVVNSGNIIPATANVTLEKDGEKFTGVSTGDGPIDAAFHAIEQIIGHHYELDDFQVHAVTKGRGAVGSSIIRLRANGKLYPGNGVSTDIVGACIRAYINALNKIVYEEN